MEYYYTPKENISAERLLIQGDEAKHLGKVLRKKEGEVILVTDGERNLYEAKINRISNKEIECKILEKSYNVNEPEIKVSLFQSLLKKPERFEFVIEKATELGVNEIFPVISENVVNKETDRHERWQSIAVAAMKQSQRCYLPQINNPLSFEEAIQKATNYGINLIAHERGEKEIRSFGRQPQQSIGVFIGPEGGFSDTEIEKALNCGFELLNLGRRKFRSETATIVILGLIFMAE
jgi:16S rRNA (uracil1498-N3)-methyltransferase